MSAKRHRPLSEQALLRFHVISQLRARLLQGVPPARAVAEVAASWHPTAQGELVEVSRRTVYRWLARYEQGGIDALEDAPRPASSSSTVLSPELLRYVTDQRHLDPEASIPELIKRARATGRVRPDEPICRQTVYRALQRMGLSTQRRTKQRGRDARRFAYPHRMDMVLCDGKHFRAGAARHKRMAYFFLDDASRYGLHVVVGTSENAVLFLRGLYETIRCWGLMSLLFLDRGPGFIAGDTAEVCRRLDVGLVLGEARYPEGRGKVERFNRTVTKDVLRHLVGQADVDPACAALELRLSHYLREVYNHAPHESLPFADERDA
jgi:transposase InsO family protein